MSEKRKDEIIMATLKLASKKGLGAVSMNMIAQEIGIKKPSLYNHFKSKDELVNEMYLLLKNKAQEKTKTKIDFKIFENNSASEILKILVHNYVILCSEENIQMFYKVIYSERSISSEAAKIMVAETEKMIEATKQIFALLQSKNLLKFKKIEICAMNFALTIHGLMDYLADKSFSDNETISRNTKLIDEYIENFCDEHLI